MPSLALPPDLARQADLTTHAAPLGSALRLALGLYFAVQFARLLPHATALYTAQGMLPDAALNPPTAAFPTGLQAALHAWATPTGAPLLLLVGVGLALALALGRIPKVAAVGLWATQALLWHRNVLTLNPTLPINGFLLLCTLALPAPAPAAPAPAAPANLRPRGAVPLPADLSRVLWIVAGVAYSVSGLTKLDAPSWRSGEALGLILSGPLARDLPWVEALCAAPLLLKILTWGTLALEIGFGLLALSARLRPWVLLATTGLHLGILATVQFAELTLGMLPLHLALMHPGRTGAAWARLCRHCARLRTRLPLARAGRSRAQPSGARQSAGTAPAPGAGERSHAPDDRRPLGCP